MSAPPPVLPPELADTPLLRGLSEAELADLFAHARRVSLEPGEVLFQVGASARDLVFVVQGELHAVYSDPESDHEVLLNTFGPGDHLGEAAIGSDSPRTATVRADQASVVLCVPVDDPDAPWVVHLARRLVDIFSERLFVANDRQLVAVRGQLEEQTRRVQTGRFLLYVLGGLGAYAIGLSAVSAIADDYVLYNAITSAGLLAYVGGIAWLAWQSTYPASFFGVVVRPGWGRELLESVTLSAVVLAALTGLKAAVVACYPGIGPIFAERWVHLQPEAVGLIGALVYAALCPLQEFLARGVLQGSLEEFMAGSPAATPWSIVLASGLFAAAHAHISPVVPPITFAFGLLWGWMYHRHRSLLGVSVSHMLIGLYGLELLDGSLLVRAAM